MRAVLIVMAVGVVALAVESIRDAGWNWLALIFASLVVLIVATAWGFG